MIWLTLLSHIHAIVRLQDHLCLGWIKKTESQMKSLFWLTQAMLFCSILYYSPLLSPLISHNWSMEEWSVRYGQYRDCISRKRPEGHSSKGLRRSCNSEAYGLPFLSFLTESIVKLLTTILRLLVRICAHDLLRRTIFVQSI